MNENSHIVKTSMPDTRPADYYLSCLGGCVFIDFDLGDNGLIYLRRISFDGYGCCRLSQEAIPFDKSDSALFQHTYRQLEMDQKIMSRLIYTALNLNRSNLWEAPLKAYDLLDDKQKP
ncbi:MAG: hypothetical protein Roseis2KO_48460 [Roseivirga sp.]